MDILKTITLAQERKLKRFAQGMEGLWNYQGKVSVPTSDGLRNKI